MKTIYTAEQLKSVYGEPQVQQPTPEPQKEGILKSIVKDVAGTLVVNPVTRVTEAVTRTAFPESQAAKGFEILQEEGQGQDVLGVNVPSLTGGARQITGEALKTASYLFPYGKVAGLAGKAVGKIGGNVISGATGGYLADVGYGLTEGETTGEALTPGAGTAIGAAIPLVGPTLRGTGRAVSKLGEKTVETVIPVSKREASILQTYKANNPFFKRVADVLQGTEQAPTTAGKTATRTTAGQTLPGLFGTKSQIGVQAKRAKDSLWKDVIQPRLRASEQAVDLDGFFAKVEDDIIKSNPELSRQKSLLEALNAVKEDYAGTKAVSLEGLQKLKEGWAKFVPDKAYQGKPIGGAFNDVRNQLADEARQTIYSQLGDDVKQAYFDYGNLQGLTEMGKVSMTGQKLKGGTGGLLSELLSQTITPIGTVGGQAVYRLGKGIEFVGNLGAKNLGEALGVNLKFPGDMAVDDISKTVKKAKSLPNKQGGFIKLGQDAKAPMATQANQTTRMTPNTSNIPKSSPKTSTKSIDPLINEAKKYKSAEEFVKAQGTPVYHGTKKNLPKNLNTDKVIFTTLDKNYASKYGNINEMILPQNTKIKSINNLDLTKDLFNKKFNSLEEFYKTLKKEGYDAIKLNNIEKGHSEIIVLKPEILKTKSQLTDIWNKANKTVSKADDSLVSEAKKYKSAEEFVKAQPSFYRGEGGSNVAQGKALLAEGKHFASDAEYPKGFGKVVEYSIKPNIKVLDLEDSTFAEISQKLGIPERKYISPKELAQIAKEKGYGVLKYDGEYASTGKKFNHIVDLTGDSTIPKSQLEEIWKKANSKANKK